jgi:ribosomal protein L11 methyltransferase
MPPEAAPPIAFDVTPRFRIVHHAGAADARSIVLVPSAAFGDGRHESTQMCLMALAAFAPGAGFRMLDVGSGSGILSIAAAKLGGHSLGVEIDPAANAVARTNACASGVADAVAFDTSWPDGPFDVVVANILRDVLLELADDIVHRLASGGLLVLAGLVSTDVPVVLARYAPALGNRRPDIFERSSWRTLLWRASPSSRAST